MSSNTGNIFLKKVDRQFNILKHAASTCHNKLLLRDNV